MLTRSLVFELSPPILYELGFEPAMEWLAEHMEQQYGLVVSVEDDDLPKPLDNEARVLLFRAVRELLFNVLERTQASYARVRMLRDGDHLRVIVEDNGVGFAAGQPRDHARENGRFRSLQHSGTPELFRRPDGDRVQPRGASPGLFWPYLCGQTRKKAHRRMATAPHQGNRPAGGLGP